MKIAKALLITALISQATFVGAQSKIDWDATNVIVIGDPQNEVVQVEATEYFRNSLRSGFRQVGMPKFLITDKKSRAVFAIGGFVNFRTAYDFNNVIGNIDFTTYDIPMQHTASNNQRLLMDASTSRIYFKALINTPSGKPIETYVETDFRGTNYALRLREAYVSWNGILAGQTVTTFCDQSASFNTIDFEGPNGYTYSRNLMLQYTHGWDNGVSFGVAAEYPVVSAEVGSSANLIPQRVPDIPAYVQYAWNDGASHIRASGVLRNMFYENKVEGASVDQIGWGAQLSGVWKMNSRTTLYGQVLYGKGITPYVQDLSGNGLDMVPDHNNHGTLYTPISISWLAGVQYNITPQMPITLGYSQVLVENDKRDVNPKQYKLAQYVVMNVFYNFNKSLSVGAEYLYGTRYDQDNSFGKSNRVQMSVQFNF